MTDGANAVLDNAASVAASARTITDQAIDYAGKFNQTSNLFGYLGKGIIKKNRFFTRNNFRIDSKSNISGNRTRAKPNFTNQFLPCN